MKDFKYKTFKIVHLNIYRYITKFLRSYTYTIKDLRTVLSYHLTFKFMK